MSEQAGLRGKAWFQALTGKGQPQTGDPASVWSANEKIGPQTALFLCVVPNLESRFPCVRDGQVGLEEAYTLTARVCETMDAGLKQPRSQKRPLLGILHELLHVDSPVKPTQSDIDTVKQAIVKAIDEARQGAVDLDVRRLSDAAKETRKAGIAARALLEQQWLEA